MWSDALPIIPYKRKEQKTPNNSVILFDKSKCGNKLAYNEQNIVNNYGQNRSISIDKVKSM